MILRHGKSDWYAGAATDHERPLNKRGNRAAVTMGKVLSSMGEAPDLIYTSSATRASQTATLAADAGNWKCKRIEVEDLYSTSATGALTVATQASNKIDRLMLVGHEPTWSYLVRTLTGASVEMKTGTLAAVDLSIGSWSEAIQASGSLAYLLQPRLFTAWDL